MSGNRTEQPTPRRLREARRRGEVAVSRELTGAAALAGGLAALAASAPGAAAELGAMLRAALAAAGGAPASPAAALQGAAAAVLRLSLPACGAALAVGAAAAALQAGPGLSFAALAPRLERIDPARGLRRLLSGAQLAAAALGLAKSAVLAALAWGWLAGAAPSLAALPRLGPAALWRAPAVLGGLAWRLAAAFAVLGALDLALVRRRHRRALMMTRDEVRREHREDEGDPLHRAARQRRHRALLEAPAVARATVVVVNPTHLAVALQHDRRGGGAPRVVAKGAGEAAARIRSAARRAGVPVVRDVALARALHRLAEVGDEIPEALYEAAAAVLAHLYGLEAQP
ncbi:type III secretion exporter [Anaeromyxobacter dehalogenans 2CP-1]|uniref:Type III secretion exporter n=1 Tax=Anaeromyxobacter dehalogenans (strain ATCC BAA-258 / DSM 21875 / 2CP-1) TaxID=455488 RepID=B8JD63_ANAD2|nr:EscU/YscU/HrcU family type III secretion system export apparatus switch protein [Anaeromyxobacter dehalogenans]ACL64091.1 type III secretion exporter [Anaeromyxobacter dehalogenans 2CP-1]